MIKIVLFSLALVLASKTSISEGLNSAENVDANASLLYAPSIGNTWAKFLALSTNKKVLRQKPGYAGVECHPRIAENCQNMFSTWLSAETNIFRSPKLVRQTFQKHYNKSLETGLLKMCAYRAAFFDCLQDLYEPCTDPFQIYTTQQPISFEDSFLLSFLYKSLAFDCLGGNVQLTTNYNCFLEVQKNPASQQANEICHKSFHEANKADPQNFCSSAQTYLKCASSVFVENSICPSKELAWWRCEHIRTGFQVDGFCPDLDCNFVLAPASAAAGPPASANVPTSTEQEWRRKLIGGGAFVSHTRLNVYKKLNLVPNEQPKTQKN